jgi:hypothetical protein
MTSELEQVIKIKEFSGTFAENKDKAQEIRLNYIEPAIQAEKTVILDFSGVEGATQSFVHALISDLIRTYSNEILDKLLFKDCAEPVKQIISIVVDYMQQID